MSKNQSRALRLLRKSLRFTLYFIIAIVLLVNAFILLSGRMYLYKGIASTYLVGESSPTIYDLDKFAYRTLEKGVANEAWIKTNNSLKPSDIPGFVEYNEKWDSRGFLVFKGDSILFETYFVDHKKETVSNSFSAAKTVVALLIGAAMDDGLIKSLDEPVGNYIPEFKEGDKSIITIRNLLNMASGLDWTESGKNPLSNNAESYYGDDLYKLVTSQKLVTKPGRTFLYQSGNSQLLGFIIKAATGKSVAQYCDEKLWSKMGMESDAFWSLDREDGDEKAFCCLYATARDFGRIGKLIAHDGKWGNEQLIPAWYIREMAVVPHQMNTEEGVLNHQYGLHVWVYDGYKSPVIYCRGIKGQYIITIPEEDLVIVRVGNKRAPNYEPEVGKILNEKELNRIGHPRDLIQYINFAERILESSK